MSTGAGANSRIAIGTAVIGGMLTATILAIFYIPFFFVLVRRGVRDGIDRRPRAHRPPAGGAGMKRAVALIALLATGCTTMEPTLRPARPGDPGVVAGRRSLSRAGRGGAARRSPTSRSSSDPRLQTLIAQALVNNRDLMVAAANIAAAREQYRIQRAQPVPDSSTPSARQRPVESASTGSDQAASSRANITAGVSVPSFELDLFGRAALADPCPARAISRDRSRRARDAPDPGRATSPAHG